MREIFDIECDLVQVLKTICDPEIPCNIYDLGLIYAVEVTDEREVMIVMTLTAPGCPVAEDLMNEVKDAVAAIDGVEKVSVELVFDPPWTQERMSEEAKLELGML